MIRIRKIEIKSVDKIYIELDKTAASKSPNGIVGKKMKITSDLIPHRDFFRAIERMTPHLLFGSEIMACEYGLINKKMPIDAKYFNEWEWKDDPRFKGVKLTGVIVVGKETPDAIKLVGYKERSDGKQTKLITPEISLYRGDNEYELVEFLDTQFDTLLTEATEYETELKYHDGDQLDLFNIEENEKKTAGMRVA